TDFDHWTGSEPEVGIVSTKSPLNTVFWPSSQTKLYQNVVPGFPRIWPLKETVVGQSPAYDGGLAESVALVICAFAGCVAPMTMIAAAVQQVDLTIRHGVMAGLPGVALTPWTSAQV